MEGRGEILVLAATGNEGVKLGEDCRPCRFRTVEGQGLIIDPSDAEVDLIPGTQSLWVTGLQKHASNADGFGHDRPPASFDLPNQVVHLRLVLSPAPGARGVFHHARGLGLAHTLARVGFHSLRRRKSPWLAFRHPASRTGFASSALLRFPVAKMSME